MSGSSFGKNFKVTTFGESHSKAVGVIVDGMPSGIEFEKEIIRDFLNRRKTKDLKISTNRCEEDEFEVLSGVYDGRTIGTPVAIIVYNKDANSADYESIKDIFRPGHADYTYYKKYDHIDYRGGSRSSGRETVGRVIAGALAYMILKRFGITFISFTEAIGEIFVTDDIFDEKEINKNSLFVPSKDVYVEMKNYLEEIKKENDSIGGIVQCIVKNVPAGLGEPIFRKCDAVISQAVMSIGAVKAIEIGEGIGCAVLKGSEFSDQYEMINDEVKKLSNNTGGIVGGITDGSSIMIRAYIKPTPSIGKEQQSVNKDGNNVTLSIKGRHDTCIVPRACVVVESMVAITLADLILENAFSNVSNLDLIYKNNK